MNFTHPLIDIGANLGHDSFDHDLEAVLERAHTAGLVHQMVTGTTLPASQKALALCRQHPGLSATAGIHPHEASQATLDVLGGIRELLDDPLVRAVGETGLDFNRDYSPRPVQEESFEAHLQMAVETGLPAFLHQRDAHSRFLPILKHYRDHLSAVVVHCFTDSKEALYDYIDLDLYIGITGWICDERRGSHLHAIVGDIPADRLMIETDAPYLLPRSLRPKPKSRRNEPAYLAEVLSVVAEHCGKPATVLAEQTTANAIRFFNIPDEAILGRS